MSERVADATPGANRGAIIRLFGVVLVILGTLDSMLMWRGGFADVGPYVLLIAAGLLLYAVGAMRRRGDI